MLFCAVVPSETILQGFIQLILEHVVLKPGSHKSLQDLRTCRLCL